MPSSSIRRIVVAVIALLPATMSIGCSTTRVLEIVPARPMSSERVIEKSYELGQKRTAWVGDAVVRVKDYHIAHVAAEYVEASVDFSISTRYSYLRGSADRLYPVVAVVTIDTEGETCQLKAIRLERVEGASALALARPDGSVHPNLLEEHRLAPESVACKPDDLRFRFTARDTTELDVGSGYTDYEVIFTGRDETSLKFLYREFSPEDVATPSFFQNLVHQPDSQVIRFLQTRIRLHDVNDERIVYTVLEDGY